jgi:hypothetical protein
MHLRLLGCRLVSSPEAMPSSSPSADEKPLVPHRQDSRGSDNFNTWGGERRNALHLRSL